MTLARKIARLEELVKVQAEATVPTYWTPERIGRWEQSASRLLETMGEERAQRAFAELTTTPADEWGTVARRVHHHAYFGADGHYDAVGWPYWADTGPSRSPKPSARRWSGIRTPRSPPTSVASCAALRSRTGRASECLCWKPARCAPAGWRGPASSVAATARTGSGCHERAGQAALGPRGDRRGGAA